MAKYLIARSGSAGEEDGPQAFIVEAENLLRAYEYLEDRTGQYGWSTAEILDQITDRDSLSGYHYEISISGENPGDPDIILASVAGDPTTIGEDDLGAKLVTALNQHPLVSGASYGVPSDWLTVAAGSDYLGDRALKATVRIPGSPFGRRYGAFFGAQEDRRTAGDPLRILLKNGRSSDGVVEGTLQGVRFDVEWGAES